MNIKALRLVCLFSSILISSVAIWLLSTSKSEVSIMLKKIINEDNAIHEPDVKVLSINEQPLIKDIPIDVPLINQLPELVRGCEVTSLAMLLQFAGVDVDKLTLAEEVKKVPYLKNGVYGHPNDGFVGNMYTYNHSGYGVFDQPIEDLANKYLPGQIQNITGTNFDSIKEHLLNDRPVWVIITSTYKKVPSANWEVWNTKSGEISITKKQHSVVLTGFDDQYVYFNDPLASEKNSSAPIEEFIDGWNQFGNKAIIVNPENSTNIVKR